MSLEQAISLALSSSHNLEIEHSKLRESRHKQDEALGRFGLNLEFQASGSRTDPASQAGALVVTPNNDYQGNLILTQPLIDFGRSSWTRQATSKDVESAEMTVRTKRDETIETTSRRYLNALYLIDRTRVREAELESRGQALRDAQTRFEVGTAARFEVLRAQAALSRAEQDLLTAETEKADSLTELSLSLGLAPESDLELDPPLIVSPKSQDFQVVKEAALRDRPELRDLSARLASAKANLKLTQSRDRPRLDLEGRLTARQEIGFSPGLQNTITLNLKIPILDGGVNRAQRRQAEERIAQLESQIEQRKRDILLELYQVQREVQTTWSAIPVAERGESEARESLRVARLRYQHGVSTQVEYLEASENFLEAQSRLILAKRDYHTATWRWKRVTAQL